MVNLKRLMPIAGTDTARSAINYIVMLVCAMLVACVQPPTQTAPADASQALEKLVREYEKGDLKTLEAMLPISFVGRDSLLDAARRAANDQRNTRVELSDQQTQTTGASQALSVRWEKRFTRASSGAAVIERGTMRVVLRRAGEAWQFENLPADNLFTR
jgi:hypothetical protein